MLWLGGGPLAAFLCVSADGTNICSLQFYSIAEVDATKSRKREGSLPPTACPLSRLLQGSLASGTFAAYSPVTREAEICDVQPSYEGMEMEAEEEL